MKKLILLFASVFMLAVATQAQSDAKISSDEVAQVSASLKEAYGILSQDMARLGREIGPDQSKATADQRAMRERMEKALGQLESVLTTVNTVGPDQWADAKAKAELVRQQALAIVAEREKR